MRLWREPDTAGDAWRGEVEHIQSGAVVTISSIEEVLSLIRHTTAGDEQHRGESESHPHANKAAGAGMVGTLIVEP